MNKVLDTTVDKRISVSAGLHRRLKRFVQKRGYKLGAYLEMTLDTHLKDQIAAERARRSKAGR